MGDRLRGLRLWRFGATPRVVWSYALFFANPAFTPSLAPALVRMALIAGTTFGALVSLGMPRSKQPTSKATGDELPCGPALGMWPLMILACLATLALGLDALVGLSGPLVAVLAVLIGIETGVEISAWTCAYARVGLREACVSSAGSNAAGTVLVIALFLLGSLSPTAMFVVIAPCPVLSRRACASYRRHLSGTESAPDRPAAAHSGSGDTPLPHAYFAGLAAYGLAYGFTLGYLAFCSPAGSSVGLSHALLTLAAAAGLVALATWADRDERISLTRLYLPVLPLFVAGILFFLFIPPSMTDIALLPTNLGYFLLMVFNDAALPAIARTVERDVRTVAPLGWLALSGGFLAGAAGQLAAAPLADAGTALTFVVMSLSLVIVVVDRLAFAPAVGRISQAGESCRGEGARAPGAEPGIDRALDEVATEFGLTPREREVLGLLARGRDAARIQSELRISIYTARPHPAHPRKDRGSLPSGAH